MEDKFEEILDKCIDRINCGDSIKDCLADYPACADELEPLLESMLSAREAYSFVPQASAKQAAWQRFSAALRESEQKREKNRLPLPWIFGKARTWAVIATVVVIALVSYVGILQILPDDVIVTQPDAAGDFAFYVSDEQNAISDFQSLDLTISRIRLHSTDGEWIEFTPETDQVDLAQLQGDLAQQVWRGNVPQGEYSSAILYISTASGTLTNNSETIDIKINKLHLDISFNHSTDSVTEFVYDIAVISAGSGNYNLSPVAGESGTGKTIQKISAQGQDDGQGNGQGQDNDQEQGQGSGQDNDQGQGQDNGQAQGQGSGQGQNNN